ncbi:bacillithiol biosynthesis cysteine-adding enzyme BshC [Aneurinibacillus sp. REN35]|uniref:bacillithiol biosynthesis cysteine-adding enzyme BshC n=1 Tax=Aneurinibacillus sp. REN35 TaxID=3237286 RepID=UPI003526D73E
MQLEQLQLPFDQTIVRDYIHNYEKVSAFYPYAPYKQESFEKRLSWLSAHPISHRDKLADGLHAFNKEVGNHTCALDNIEKLRQPDTYVVVSGQQAGVLTGPLYTIHKAITTLRLAAEQEEKLGKAVIPVFWIAGEDHDYEEVNHTYVQTRDAEVRKVKLGQESVNRTSISHLQITPTAMLELIDAYFLEQIETEFSGAIKEKLYRFTEQAKTLTDFFARTMAWLFGEHGLVLIDAALPFVRKLEAPVFTSIIEKNEQLSQAVAMQGEKLASLGYHRQVETDIQNAQFFLYRNGERTGVTRLLDGRFETKDGSETYTTEELLRLIEDDPEQFSANVVTRPLMQEHLLPTLAFVGGPGEVAYWGMYAEAFRCMEYEMPPILPRLSFSLLEGAVQKNMRKHELSAADVLLRLAEKREQFLHAQDTHNFEGKFEAVRKQMEKLYEPLIQEAGEVERGLQKLGDKNLEKILEQVTYYEQKTQAAFVKQHEASLRQFDRIAISLFPLDKPQERVYNIFGYLNKYGMDWFREFVSYPYDIVPEHYAVSID